MHRSSKSPGGTRARHMASPAGAPRRQCNAASARCRPGAGSPGPFHGQASAWIGRAHPCLAVLWMDAWSAGVCVCVCGGAATFFFLCSKKGKGSGARAMGKKVEGRRSAGRGREGQAGGRATGWGTDLARTRRGGGGGDREPTKTRDECRVIGRQTAHM